MLSDESDPLSAVRDRVGCWHIVFDSARTHAESKEVSHRPRSGSVVESDILRLKSAWSILGIGASLGCLGSVEAGTRGAKTRTPSSNPVPGTRAKGLKHQLGALGALGGKSAIDASVLGVKPGIA